MSVSVVLLSSLLCWWSVLSVRRVGLQVGCVLTRFARARVNDRWQLGSRARANPFLMFVSEFVR